MLVEKPDLYDNVRIHCVHPGLIRTDIMANSSKHVFDTGIGGETRIKTPAQLHGVVQWAGSTSAQEAARYILYCVRRRKTRILIGKGRVV